MGIAIKLERVGIKAQTLSLWVENTMDSLNGLTTYGKTKVAGKQKNHISLREFDEKQKGDTGKEEIAEQQGYDLFSDNTFFAFIDVLGFTDSFMRSSIRSV